MYQSFRISLPKNFSPIGFSVSKEKVLFHSAQSFCIYSWNGLLLQHTLFPFTVSSAIFDKDCKNGYLIGADDPKSIHITDSKGIVRKSYTIDGGTISKDPFDHIFLYKDGTCMRLLICGSSFHLIPSKPIFFPSASSGIFQLSAENDQMFLYCMKTLKNQAIISKAPIHFLPKNL